MANKPIIIENSIEELEIFIYVIGYKEQGESILFTIKDIDTPIFTMVIDSYKSDINYTVKLLKEHNIQNVDLLCWTHPDSDHTLGLDDVINEFCKHTIFVTPEGLRERLKKFPDEEAHKMLRYIDETHQSRREAHKHYVGVANDNEYSIILTQPLVDISGRRLVFDIKSLAPIFSNIEYYKVNDVNYSKNIYSIVLVVNIGKRQFVFTGDVENRTIKCMDLEQIDDIFLLKIPHHTSKSSEALWEYYNNNYEKFNKEIPVAMTTTFKSKGLPNPNMVSKYRKICHNFYSTNIEQGEGEDKYGYICYRSKICTPINYEKICDNIYLSGLAGSL